MVTNIGEALGFVKREGPILPVQLATELRTNILFAGAILSELVSKNEVLITSVKKGSSPYYYVRGQEIKLERLSENLSGKLKEAFELIRKEKVLRDNELLPWQRVALREIKDYAIQLNVGLTSGYEIFWKWYLLDNEEVKDYIKRIVSIKKKNEKENIGKPLEETKKEKTEVKPEKISGKPHVSKKKEKNEEELEDVDYASLVSDFFEKNDIYVISQESIRKNKEMNFIVDLPSNIGKLRYFVKFRDKNILNDHDIVSALDEANKKSLPLLFLNNGELNKKAEKYLNENSSGRLVFRKIEYGKV